MPFACRCGRCGYVDFDRSRWLINVAMEEHDLASHGSHEPDLWTVTIISHADYYMIQRLSKTSAFWASLRLKFPRFSG